MRSLLYFWVLLLLCFLQQTSAVDNRSLVVILGAFLATSPELFGLDDDADDEKSDEDEEPID